MADGRCSAHRFHRRIADRQRVRPVTAMEKADRQIVCPDPVCSRHPGSRPEGLLWLNIRSTLAKARGEFGAETMGPLWRGPLWATPDSSPGAQRRLRGRKRDCRRRRRDAGQSVVGGSARLADSAQCSFRSRSRSRRWASRRQRSCPRMAHFWHRQGGKRRELSGTQNNKKPAKRAGFHR